MGDLSNVQTLLENGCSVSTLSKEEQEELLRCALNENEIFVARSALRNSCVANKLSYKEAFYLVEQTPKLVKEELLDHALTHLLSSSLEGEAKVSVARIRLKVVLRVMEMADVQQ